MNQKPKFMKPLNGSCNHNSQVKEPLQKYNFFQFHKKNQIFFLLVSYFCAMEKDINKQLVVYIVLLAVVWTLLLLVQVRLARKAFSHHKELFALKLNDVFADAVSTIDTVDYTLVDSLITMSLQKHGITYPHDLGVYSEDDEEFIVLTENADAEALLDDGYRYKLLRISDNETRMDSIIIHFPALVKRFHRDRIAGPVIIILLLLLVLCCFVNFLYIIIKQRQINSFREKMAHFITHELKTPLTTISLSAQLLKDESVVTDESTKNAYLDVINEETQVLETLVDEALTVFSLEYAPMSEMQEVNVHRLLRGVCKVHTPKLNECGATVNFDLQAEKYTMMGNRSHLFNSFSNLIDNAIKYRREQLQITISTQNVHDHIEIRIADNGIGISQKNLPMIFEPFLRFNTDNAHYVKGFGLGLDYVKHIIEYHKGAVKVESQLGEGTTFTVTLPLKN